MTTMRISRMTAHEFHEVVNAQGMLEILAVQRLLRSELLAELRGMFPGGPSNANQALRTLRRMLSYAADVGVLRGVPRIKLRKEYGREGIITAEWEALLLRVAEEPLGDIL